MYFPYIRAKQFDIDAVTEIDERFFDNDQIVPIIEPVSDKTKAKQFAKLSENKIPFVLVINPIVGDYLSARPYDWIIKTLVENTFSDYNNMWLGYIIHPTTTLKDVKDFIANYPNHYHAFIHHHQFSDVVPLAKLLKADMNLHYNIFIDGQASMKYINEFSDSGAYDILVKDGFKKRRRNEDYPAEEYFYDLHKTYSKDLGYDGFGDFTIIGSQYEPGGGPAYVVAIHLTDCDDQDNIIIKHFKSNILKPPSSADPGGKFRQSLGRAKKHIDSSPHLDTSGVKELIDLHASGHYPGLGAIKKHSIKHHIEFLHSFL